MASRRPLVNVSGSIRELPTGDTLPGVRELLTAARTYYVRTDGSDSNDGLSNSSVGAFATAQKAIDVVASLDTGIYNVTLSISAGTFGAITLKDPLGSGSVTISGAGASQTILDGASVDAVNCGLSRKYVLSALRMRSSGGSGITCLAGAAVTISGVDFGSCAAYHLNIAGGTLNGASYSVSGGAAVHWYCANGGQIVCAGITLTLSASIAFTTAFAFCNVASFMRVNANTFSGAATGVRYTVANGSVIFVSGAGESYLPGSAAGNVGAGGQYA